MTAGSDLSGIDWEDAFANADYIPNGMRYPARWATEAEAFRARAGGTLDIAYGHHPREKFDLFTPEGTALGLVVIVHGGFWRAFDKNSWSHLAAGPLALGWAVALPSYTLAPEADLPQMTQQIGTAIRAAAAMVDGPLCLTGHSAGGHLVSRMVCEGSPLPDAVTSRLQNVVSISGLHDLRPLRAHSMDADLRLTEDTARAESAALQRPLSHVPVTAWVGARERPEFLRQSALLAEAWDIPLVADPGRHHFDVIEGLCDPDHPLCQTVCQVPERPANQTAAGD